MHMEHEADSLSETFRKNHRLLRVFVARLWIMIKTAFLESRDLLSFNLWALCPHRPFLLIEFHKPDKRRGRGCAARSGELAGHVEEIALGL